MQGAGPRVHVWPGVPRELLRRHAGHTPMCGLLTATVAQIQLRNCGGSDLRCTAAVQPNSLGAIARRANVTVNLKPSRILLRTRRVVNLLPGRSHSITNDVMTAGVAAPTGMLHHLTHSVCADQPRDGCTGPRGRSGTQASRAGVGAVRVGASGGPGSTVIGTGDHAPCTGSVVSPMGWVPGDARGRELAACGNARVGSTENPPHPTDGVGGIGL